MASEDAYKLEAIKDTHNRAVRISREAITWLIEQAEKVESLQNQLDAKLVFINNGWEEERYVLQDKVEQLEKERSEAYQAGYKQGKFDELMDDL